MKFLSISLSLFVFGLMSLSPNTTQAQNTEELLSQKWMVDKEAFSAAMGAEIAVIALKDPEMAESMKKYLDMAVEDAASVSMDFQRNGQLIIESRHQKQKVTWRLSADGKSIITTEDHLSRETVLTILELNENILIIQDGANESIIQFKSLNARSESGDGRAPR